jgi:hypothetical protein
VRGLRFEAVFRFRRSATEIRSLGFDSGGVSFARKTPSPLREISGGSDAWAELSIRRRGAAAPLHLAASRNLPSPSPHSAPVPACAPPKTIRDDQGRALPRGRRRSWRVVGCSHPRHCESEAWRRGSGCSLRRSRPPQNSLFSPNDNNMPRVSSGSLPPQVKRSRPVSIRSKAAVAVRPRKMPRKRASWLPRFE